MFQWKPNPNYVEGGGVWYSFTRPLNELLPDFYLIFSNAYALITGNNFLYNGKMIRCKNWFLIHNFLLSATNI